MHQPIGPRIADAVAEDGVQAEARLIDEIIHIALDGAVVIAEKHHPLPAVEKHPAREMDRPDPPQPAGPDEMPRRIIHGREDADGVKSRTTPGLRLPIALNWLVTS